jgi:hypothetical protein
VATSGSLADVAEAFGAGVPLATIVHGPVVLDACPADPAHPATNTIKPPSNAVIRMLGKVLTLIIGRLAHLRQV